MQTRSVSSPPLVLVADADQAMRIHLNRILTQAGFAVTLTDTGTQALEVYRRHRQAITLVVLAKHLPDLDGLATLAGLQTINPQVRCWFLAGDAGCASEEELLKRGALVLRQPLDVGQLQQALAELVTEAAPCAP